MTYDEMKALPSVKAGEQIRALIANALKPALSYSTRYGLLRQARDIAEMHQQEWPQEAEQVLAECEDKAHLAYFEQTGRMWTF